MAEFNYSSVALDTQLSGPVSGSDTALTVDATTGFPAVPFNLTVDAGEVNEEIVTVTAIVGQVLTVSRGQDGTVATSHLSGAKVKHQAIGRDLQRSRDHEAASAGVHGLDPGDEVVGRAATLALENKTIDGNLNTLQNIPQAAVVNLDGRLVNLEASDWDHVVLSNATPPSTSEVQWGSQDINFGSFPGPVKVFGQVNGWLNWFQNTGRTFATVRVEISLDGGSTWTEASSLVDISNEEGETRATVMATHSRGGTPTGDVIIRAKAVHGSSAANGNITYTAGRLYAQIKPA